MFKLFGRTKDEEFVYPIGWDWNRESIKQVESFKSRWEQTKMTREEAITLTKDIAHKSSSDHMIVLNILEALGLIKFDEPKIPSWVAQYKSWNIEGMVNELVRLKHSSNFMDRGLRIDFLKNEIQLKLVRY